MSAARRFELDRSAVRRGGGRLLVGGTPPRLVRLTEAGATALDSLLAGGAGDRATAAIAERLERAGLLHPLPGDGAADPPVTAVIPARDGGEPLVDLVRVLAAEGPVIVIDDGSRDGSPERAAAVGARVIEVVGPGGPAAARNAGLRAAETELVALVDGDCVLAPGWRAGLATLLDIDPSLAIVAPRVRGGGDSAIGRYERLAAPLDLGPAASLVGPRRKVSYLPAAALLARRDALLGLGGFDETMRFGEDVDLIWRLPAAGLRARYVPSREVLHLPRESRGGFTRQRAGYGSSAPELVRRHGSAAAPLRVGPHAVGVWLGALALGPRGALAALAASSAIVASRGKDRNSRAALATLALRGNGEATRHLARAMVREWLPLTLGAASISRRARRALVLAFLLDSSPIWSQAAKRPADALASTALHALDRSAYAAGMWREMCRREDFTAALPRR